MSKNKDRRRFALYFRVNLRLFSFRIVPKIEKMKITILLQAHTAKYAQKRFGEVIKPTVENWFGVALLYFLKKGDWDNQYNKYVGERLYYPLTVHLSNYQAFDLGQTCTSAYAEAMLNSLLVKDFNRELCSFCDCKMSQGVKMTEAVFDFMNFYGLSENDVKFETLKKYYYRHRVKEMPQLVQVKGFKHANSTTP